MLVDLLRKLLDYNAETGEFRWRVSRGGKKPGDIAGCKTTHGYWVIYFHQKLHYAHRLSWLYIYGEWPRDQIDHINGNRCDNRLCNLREASQSQNNGNTRRRHDNISGFKGVYWHSSANKWSAEVALHGKKFYLGLFDNYLAACAARTAKANKVFGRFARHE